MFQNNAKIRCLFSFMEKEGLLAFSLPGTTILLGHDPHFTDIETGCLKTCFTCFVASSKTGTCI